MNRSTIYSRTLRILDTNSTAYPQADFNSDLNESLALRTMEILRLNGYKHITQTHAYTDLISKTGLVEGDNGFNGEYALPTDLLTLERIEVSYDGENWEVMSKENGRLYDISESNKSEQNEDIIQGAYTTSSPRVMILRGSMFIRPLNDEATVTNGIHLYYAPRQADLDEDADSPVFETNLHQALIYDCAEMEMMAHPNSFAQLKERRVLNKKEKVDKEFKNFYRTRMKPVQEVKVKQENFK